MNKLVNIMVLFITSFAMRGQDPAFSQFYSCPLYLNPALAGYTECGRLGLNYRLQNPGFDAFNTLSIAYDQNIDKINSGIGALITAYLPDKILKQYSLNLLYAYQFKLSQDLYMRTGLSAGIRLHQINANEIILPDGANEGISDGTFIIPDFSIGTYVTYMNKYYGGFSASHFTSTIDMNTSSSEYFSKTNTVKYSLHAGACFSLDRKDEFLLSPNFIFQYQDHFNNFNVGLYSTVKIITFGLWYKNNLNFSTPDLNTHSLCVLAGIDLSNVKVGYSYDFNLSGLGIKSMGAHEISITWDFCVYVGTQKRIIKAIKSPYF